MTVAGTPFTCFTVGGQDKSTNTDTEETVVCHLSARIGTYMGSYVSSWQELVSFGYY